MEMQDKIRLVKGIKNSIPIIFCISLVFCVWHIIHDSDDKEKIETISYESESYRLTEEEYRKYIQPPEQRAAKDEFDNRVKKLTQKAEKKINHIVFEKNCATMITSNSEHKVGFIPIEIRPELNLGDGTLRAIFSFKLCNYGGATFNVTHCEMITESSSGFVIRWDYNGNGSAKIEGSFCKEYQASTSQLGELIEYVPPFQPMVIKIEPYDAFRFDVARCIAD